MEAVIIAGVLSAAPSAATAVAKGVLGKALQEVYTIIKYRFKNRGETHNQVELLVTQLDLEAKLDTVGALVREIHSSSPSVQIALRRLHEKVVDIKELLERLAGDADDHSKKWLAEWRGVPSPITHNMKKLEASTKILDSRLALLLHLLAAQPAIVQADHPQTERVATIKEMSDYQTSVMKMEPLGPRHLLNPLEQSWVNIDNTKDEHVQTMQEEDDQKLVLGQEVIEEQIQLQIQQGFVHEDSDDHPQEDSERNDQSLDIVVPNTALLQEMQGMGFVDMEVNSKVLVLAKNDLDLAVSMILKDF